MGALDLDALASLAQESIENQEIRRRLLAKMWHIKVHIATVERAQVAFKTESREKLAEVLEQGGKNLTQAVDMEVMSRWDEEFWRHRLADRRGGLQSASLHSKLFYQLLLLFLIDCLDCCYL